MAVCQNLPLGALSSRSETSVLVGALFKKIGLFFLTQVYRVISKLYRSYDRSLCSTKEVAFHVSNYAFYTV
jgi:hypothetical protein